jgi:hypothetical protein
MILSSAHSGILTEVAEFSSTWPIRTSVADETDVADKTEQSSE